MTDGSHASHASALVYPRTRSRSDRMYEVPIIGKRYVEVPPGRLFLRTATPVGDRASLPVVCLQGPGSSSKTLLPLLQQLGRRFVSLAPELPDARPSDQVERLTSLLDVLGLWRAAVLATSLGGALGLELAIQQPQRVAALVLVGPPAASPERPLAGQLWQWVRTEGWRSVNRWRSARLLHWDEKLPRISAPSLIVRGSRDAVCPQAWAERLAAQVPAGRWAVVPGAAHAVQTEAPLELSRILTPFLRSPG